MEFNRKFMVTLSTNKILKLMWDSTESSNKRISAIVEKSYFNHFNHSKYVTVSPPRQFEPLNKTFDSYERRKQEAYPAIMGIE